VREKRVPHHDLARVQALVVQLGPSAFTRTALNGGFALGLTWHDMVEVVRTLDGTCFYKSMTSWYDSTEWQDVYHAPLLRGRTAYIKITWRQRAPVIQFKER
jgi:motility quorum-sensing regulator / GCU-specific mRNA interferase toxin